MLKIKYFMSYLVFISFLMIGAYNVEAMSTEDEVIFQQLDITSKIIEKAKSRQAKVTDFDSMLKTEGLNREEIYNIGYYYSGDNGEIKLQIKKNKDKIKEEKVTKLISKLQDKYGNNNVTLEYVTHSYKELEGILIK